MEIKILVQEAKDELKKIFAEVKQDCENGILAIEDFEHHLVERFSSLLASKNSAATVEDVSAPEATSPNDAPTPSDTAAAEPDTPSVSS